MPSDNSYYYLFPFTTFNLSKISVSNVTSTVENTVNSVGVFISLYLKILGSLLVMFKRPSSRYSTHSLNETK